MARADAWTHEEMILVLNLYLKLPFGKMDRRNPDVINLAKIIGRTPKVHSGTVPFVYILTLGCLLKFHFADKKFGRLNVSHYLCKLK